MGWARESTGQRAGGDGTSVRLRYGAKARIRTDSGLLLIKERHDDGTPFWTLPGGGSRPAESHTETLVRELREELDCTVEVSSHVGTVWYAHESDSNTVSLYSVFDCRLLDVPTPNRKEGVCEHRWVETPPPRTLPQVRYCCW